MTYDGRDRPLTMASPLYPGEAAYGNKGQSAPYESGDAYQQLCKTIEPETVSTVMACDAAGNLSWSASGQVLPSTTACRSLPRQVVH